VVTLLAAALLVATPAAPVKRQIVDTRFGQVHVRSTKGGGRPLVLLHMSPVSGWMFEAFLRTMGHERTLVAPDRLGFGFSDSPPRALGMDDFARATLDALDALAIREFDLLGVHTGSVEAVALVHLAPARVSRLGLVAAPVFNKDEVARLRATLAGHAPAPTEDGSYLVPTWRKRFAYRQPPYNLPLMHERFVQELLSADNKTATYEAVFTYPLADRLKTLSLPLVVFAPHDDIIEQTERARPLLPKQAVYVDLPDLHLDAFEEHPERMAELVRKHFP
jgi:pimeloyl-ACP methyl ester carboxylesterase